MVIDLVSPEARRIESEIDDAHKSSLVLTLPRPEACWWILTASALLAINHFRAGPQRSAIASGGILVYVLRRLFLWANGLRNTRQQLPPQWQPDHFEAARDLISAADAYGDAEVVFSLASNGMIGLDVENGVLIPRMSPEVDQRYEAYCRLHRSDLSAGNPSQDVLSDYSAIQAKVKEKLSIIDGCWTLPLNPQLVADASALVSRLDTAMFQ